MSDGRAKDLLGISSKLFTTKRPWDQMCQSIAEIFYPMRADFTQNFTLGEDFSMDIMDGYTVQARETLANNIGSMLRQGDWFEIGTGDEERDEATDNAMSLERATKFFMQVIKDPRTGFDKATNQADHDWTAFGNPVLSWEESRGRDHLVTRAWHPGHCAWMLDENDQVNAVYRKFSMTARNIKAKVTSGAWKGNIHADIESACRLEPHREYPMLHVMMPTEDLYHSDGKKLREIRHPFISVYLDCEHEEYMSEGGSPVFNYTVPRWRTFTGRPQGFSPAAANCLPDGRMLQAMARVIIEQGEKAIDPPLIGSGEVFTRDIQAYSGGFTMVDLPDDMKLGDKMTVLNTSQDLRIGVELKADIRALIAESFLLNKLFLPSAREMREIEVAVRTEEFRRAALPFFTPIEAEYHTPFLGTGFEMAVNMGLIPARIFTEELQGSDIKFTFNSPLQEAEGRKAVEALTVSMQLIAAGTQVDPTLPNLFNIRKATVDAVRGAGAAPDWFVPEDEIEKKDAEAEQVKAMTQGAQIAREGAGVLADVSNASLAASQAGM